MTDRFTLISGCSGGGKSTLVDALGAAGFAVVPEPGRRIIEQEQGGRGCALPWVDMQAFARRAVAMARRDLQDAQLHDDPVFFDRGLIDAAVALQAAGGPAVRETIGGLQPYGLKIIMAPPWSEIYATDAQRRHGFEEATTEYDRLRAAIDGLGFEIAVLPKLPVPERVAFVLKTVGLR